MSEPTCQTKFIHQNAAQGDKKSENIKEKFKDKRTRPFNIYVIRVAGAGIVVR